MNNPTHILVCMNSFCGQADPVNATIAYSQKEAEKLQKELSETYDYVKILECDYSVRRE